MCGHHRRPLLALVTVASRRLASVLSQGKVGDEVAREAAQLIYLLHDVLVSCTLPQLPPVLLDHTWQSLQFIKVTGRWAGLVWGLARV